MSAVILNNIHTLCVGLRWRYKCFVLIANIKAWYMYCTRTIDKLYYDEQHFREML